MICVKNVGAKAHPRVHAQCTCTNALNAIAYMYTVQRVVIGSVPEQTCQSQYVYRLWEYGHLNQMPGHCQDQGTLSSTYLAL